MTALGYAAAKGHYDVVKLLIEKGANPELKSKILMQTSFVVLDWVIALKRRRQVVLLCRKLCF